MSTKPGELQLQLQTINISRLLSAPQNGHETHDLRQGTVNIGASVPYFRYFMLNFQVQSA